MKHFLRTHTCFFLFLVITFSSCLEDDSVQESDLLGEWEITSAFRNGALTESLSDLYFHFTEGGELHTNMNMTGLGETYQFEIDGQSIYQRNGDLDVDYVVDFLTKDSLILLTKLRDKDFKMVLSRKE